MARPIGPEVAHSLQSIADSTISPDGFKVAYTLSWAEQPSLEGRSRITMLDLDSGIAKKFTQGENDTAPRFSPDGKTCLLYTSPSPRD